MRSHLHRHQGAWPTFLPYRVRNLGHGPRLRIGAALATLALTAGIAAGCGDDDDETTTSRPEATTSSTSTSTTSSTTTTSTTSTTSTTTGSTTTSTETSGGGGGGGDRPGHDKPPPEGSPAEEFEQYCDDNPDAC